MSTMRRRDACLMTGDIACPTIIAMSLSSLPLSYCTNVHPAQTVAEVEAGLSHFTVPIAERFGMPLAAGLWLARSVVDELLALPDGPQRFADRLAARGLSCHTLNAFPYGDFHSARVKENVYLPDWTTAERLTYTCHLRGAACGHAARGRRRQHLHIAPSDLRGSNSRPTSKRDVSSA